MKSKAYKIVTTVSWVVLFWVISGYGISAVPSKSVNVPVKDKVTMVDLGAGTCIPCKLMEPILEKLKKDFEGRAAIVFIDVKERPEEAKRYKIRAIPTQVFFDKEGNEVHRHVGFMNEGDIVKQLEKMLIE